jgi:hypothetical protein
MNVVPMQALLQLLQVLPMHTPLAMLPQPSHTALLSRAASPALPPISIAPRHGVDADVSAVAAANVEGCLEGLASAVTAR